MTPYETSLFLEIRSSIDGIRIKNSQNRASLNYFGYLAIAVPQAPYIKKSPIASCAENNRGIKSTEC